MTHSAPLPVPPVPSPDSDGAPAQPGNHSPRATGSAAVPSADGGAPWRVAVASVPAPRLPDPSAPAAASLPAPTAAEPASQFPSTPSAPPTAAATPPSVTARPPNAAGQAGATGAPNPDEINAAAELLGRLAGTIGSVVLGKPQVIRFAIAALLAEGHILVEDVPGVGKTTLARALAASVQGLWRRIQFTPDLLPSDVTGITIFNQGTRGFEFHPGPVFANLVIADEINRASPKTQSALLEVMEERHVTVDGVRHPVPRPFLVVATQNPVEMDGTYRLPEAQLDRFLLRLSMGYPSEAAEIEVLRGATAGRNPDALPPVTDTATVAALSRLAQRVYLADPLYSYAVRLANATRRHQRVRIGVSPRGAIALVRAAAAYALTDGRGYVVPEDLKALAEPVFAHRLLLVPDAQIRGVAPASVVAEVLESVPAPTPA